MSDLNCPVILNVIVSTQREGSDLKHQLGASKSKMLAAPRPGRGDRATQRRFRQDLRRAASAVPDARVDKQSGGSSPPPPRGWNLNLSREISSERSPLKFRDCVSGNIKLPEDVDRLYCAVASPAPARRTGSVYGVEPGVEAEQFARFGVFWFVL